MVWWTRGVTELVNRPWLTGIVLLALDQMSKSLASHSTNVFSTGRQSQEFTLGFRPYLNTGVLLGAGQNLPHLLRAFSLLVIGVAWISWLITLLALIPPKCPKLRMGLVLCFTGLLGNYLDRLFLGGVRDFLAIGLPNSSGVVFNFADMVQWFGLGTLLFGFRRELGWIFPQDENRDRRWTLPGLQRHLIFSISIPVLLVLVVTSGFGWAALRSVAIESPRYDAICQAYGLGAIGISAAVIPALGFWGLRFSHRIAGPLNAFSRFLTELEQGKLANAVKLRETDQLKELSGFSERILALLQRKL